MGTLRFSPSASSLSRSMSQLYCIRHETACGLLLFVASDHGSIELRPKLMVPDRQHRRSDSRAQYSAEDQSPPAEQEFQHPISTTNGKTHCCNCDRIYNWDRDPTSKRRLALWIA